MSELRRRTRFQLDRVGVAVDQVGHLHERWRIVGAIARHRHHAPARLLAANELHLHLRHPLGQEVIDPDSLGMAAALSGLSTVIMIV